MKRTTFMVRSSVLILLFLSILVPGCISIPGLDRFVLTVKMDRPFAIAVTEGGEGWGTYSHPWLLNRPNGDIYLYANAEGDFMGAAHFHWRSPDQGKTWTRCSTNEAYAPSEWSCTTPIGDADVLMMTKYVLIPPVGESPYHIWSEGKGVMAEGLARFALTSYSNQFYLPPHGVVVSNGALLCTPTRSFPCGRTRNGTGVS
jgi:hypothetical protein